MADSIPNNDLNKASNDLECGICHQTYTKPKILECLHSYCEKCIDDCKIENENYCPVCKLPATKIQVGSASMICNVCGYRNPEQLYQPMLFTFPCATPITRQWYSYSCYHHVCANCYFTDIKYQCIECESNQQIPKEGVSALPTNFAIQKKLEIKRREKLTPSCQDCDKDEAISYCEECHLDLCSECTKYHKRSQRFSRHQLKDIKVASIERYFLDSRLCHQHHENLKYYCENCKVSVCNDCQLSSCHRGHQISLMSEVQQRIKNELSSNLEEAESVKTILNDYVKCGKDFCQEIEKENEKSIELVKEIFEEVREVFKKREEELIQQIHSESNKASFDKFCGSVDHLKALLSYIKSVGETNNAEINATLSAQVKCQLTKLGSTSILSMHSQGYKSPTPVQVNLHGNQQYLLNQGTQLTSASYGNKDISFNICKRIRTKATNCKKNIETLGRNFQVL